MVRSAIPSVPRKTYFQESYCDELF